ncbi:MAG: ABC transporter permease subunit [Bacteroidales bacterium]|nr:ABC transporter permease subunit [Bacteroidales bacterium]MBN2699619.1 ABC transporter permease subunit [Bacteroidales bacterium]
MNTIRILIKREFQAFFDSLIAYIMLVLFLGISGFFTWLFGADVFMVGQASLRAFFSIAYWTLFFFIPALTMRLLAEEIRSGTVELLLTKAVTDREVVIGKFLSTFILILVALLFTLPYVITISSIGNMDLGAVISGYLGLLLMSGAYISVGLWASSITKNQIVAYMTALFIGLFFHLLFGLLSTSFTGFAGQMFSYLSMQTHFESITRGVLDSGDLVYFLSIIILGLFLTETTLSKRKLSN